MGTNMLVGSSAITAGQVSGGTGFTPGVTLASIEISASYVTGTDVNAGGGTIIIAIDGAGAPASATLTQGASRAYTVGDIIELEEALLNTAGGGTGTGQTSFTLVAGNILALSPQASATITSVDLYNELDTMIADTAGSGYLVGDVLTIAAGALGAGSESGKITLVDADIVDANAFTLESRGQGVIMNSAGAENSQGALANGTNNNLRWEVVSPNTSSGTFSLIIRQGNDTSTAKRVLEIFPNVSLDPKASNYISRVVGDQKKVLRGASTADPYIETTGSYANASRYVRVKEVQYKTPNYFDNNGDPVSAFTASLPDVGSGSFAGANGALFSSTGYPTYNKALYYDQIGDNNTQGLTSTEMTATAGESNYATAFNLLANKDDYQYNIITAPGLYYAASMMTTPLKFINTKYCNIEEML
jgi:hypothetical protein